MGGGVNETLLSGPFKGKGGVDKTWLEKDYRKEQSVGGKMLIKTNSRPYSKPRAWKYSEFSFLKSPGRLDEIERLGHSLSKPLQFSLV